MDSISHRAGETRHPTDSLSEMPRGERWRHRLDRNGRPWERTPPPPYERRWKLPALAHKRDRFWRRDCLIAAAEALAAGDLTRPEHAVLSALLAMSNDVGEPVWPSQETLAAKVGLRSDRAVRAALVGLRAKGWVADHHRLNRDKETGQLRQTSNMIRPSMPALVESKRQVRRAQARKRAAEQQTRHRHSPTTPALPERPSPPLYVSSTPPKPVEVPEPGAAGRKLADRAARMASKAKGQGRASP